MKSWQAISVVLTTAFFCTFAGQGALAATTPVCKTGQVSTKAKPCVKATTTPPGATPTTTAPPAGGVQDPGNTGTRSEQTDAVTVFRFLDPSTNKYQVEVDNTSGIGYINTFNWVPPPGMTITAITSTEGGHCHLGTSSTGTAMISCVGGKKGLAPPKCTCLSGGVMTVNFTATTNPAPSFNGKYWTYYGIVGSSTNITSMTPVPYHIPSFLNSEAPDLPICTKGQTSTTAKPCLSA